VGLLMKLGWEGYNILIFFIDAESCVIFLILLGGKDICDVLSGFTLHCSFFRGK
jgi:hypothetical protein